MQITIESTRRQPHRSQLQLEDPVPGLKEPLAVKTVWGVYIYRKRERERQGYFIYNYICIYIHIAREKIYTHACMAQK